MTDRYHAEIEDSLMAEIMVFSGEDDPARAVTSVLAFGLWALKHQFKGGTIIVKLPSGEYMQAVPPSSPAPHGTLPVTRRHFRGRQGG